MKKIVISIVALVLVTFALVYFFQSDDSVKVSQSIFIGDITSNSEQQQSRVKKAKNEETTISSDGCVENIWDNYEYVMSWPDKKYIGPELFSDNKQARRVANDFFESFVLGNENLSRSGKMFFEITLGKVPMRLSRITRGSGSLAKLPLSYQYNSPLSWGFKIEDEQVQKILDAVNKQSPELIESLLNENPALLQRATMDGDYERVPVFIAMLDHSSEGFAEVLISLFDSFGQKVTFDHLIEATKNRISLEKMRLLSARYTGDINYVFADSINGSHYTLTTLSAKYRLSDHVMYWFEREVTAYADLELGSPLDSAIEFAIYQMAYEGAAEDQLSWKMENDIIEFANNFNESDWNKVFSDERIMSYIENGIKAVRTKTTEMTKTAPVTVPFIQPNIYSKTESKEIDRLSSILLEKFIPLFKEQGIKSSCKSELLKLIAKNSKRNKDDAQKRYRDILLADALTVKSIEGRFESGEISYEEAIRLLKAQQSYMAKNTLRSIYISQRRKNGKESEKQAEWKAFYDAVNQASMLPKEKVQDFIEEFAREYPDLKEHFKLSLIQARDFPYEEFIQQVEKFDIVNFQLVRRIMEQHDTDTMDRILLNYYSREDSWHFLLDAAIHSESLESFNHLLRNGVRSDNYDRLGPDILDNTLSSMNRNPKSTKFVEAMFESGVDLKYSHRQLMAAIYQINPDKVEQWIEQFDLNVTVEELENDF